MITSKAKRNKEKSKGLVEHLVNTKVYKVKFHLVEISVNVKKYY